MSFSALSVATQLSTPKGERRRRVSSSRGINCQKKIAQAMVVVTAAIAVLSRQSSKQQKLLGGVQAFSTTTTTTTTTRSTEPKTRITTATLFSIKQSFLSTSSKSNSPRWLHSTTVSLLPSWHASYYSGSPPPDMTRISSQSNEDSKSKSSSSLSVFTDSYREADVAEAMGVAYQRYNMVPLPDSMMSTTLFVGNLCEFVTDHDLSQLFASKVSQLNSVPACVVRKPNYQSLQYGFVSFPTKEETQLAIVKLNGHVFKGNKPLKVEWVRDHPTYGRVRVPEQLVDYVSGMDRKSKWGQPNGLRRISKDDVERLSRGQPSKKKGYGSRFIAHRLNEMERAELERSALKGFLTVSGAGGGYRRTRKASPLANIHRQWCDARGKPQIIVFKAIHAGGERHGGTGVLDQLVVDLSPLRLQGLFPQDDQVQEFLVKWKTDILAAAQEAGMEPQQTEDCMNDELDDENDDDDIENMNDENEEEDDSTDDCELSPELNGSDDENSNVGDIENQESSASSSSFTITFGSGSTNNNGNSKLQEAWATHPIWKLPVVSIGVFQGERSDAKRMAKALAELWEIPEVGKDPSSRGPKTRRAAGAKKGGRTKMNKGGRQERERGGGNRQAW